MTGKSFFARRIAPAVAAVLLVAPHQASAALVVAGDLIADLQAQDLDGSSTVWSNQSTSGDSVGDFTAKAGNLNVVGVGGVTKALYINENTDHAVLSSGVAPASAAGNETRSVEAWVYGDGSLRGSQGVVSWGNTNTNEFSRFTYAGGGNGLISAWFNDAGWGGAALPVDEWVHVAWTWDGTDTARGYINGALAVTTGMNSIANLATAATTLTVGASRTDASADPFRGWIADMRVHTGMLSDADVLNNYNEGIAGQIPEPSSLLLAGAGLLAALGRQRAS